MKPRIIYHPGTSLLHTLHPLIKVAWLVALTGLVFVIQHPGFNLGLTILLLSFFPLLGIKLTELRGARALLVTALLIALLQILFIDSGNLVGQLGPLEITGEGISRGIYLAARFLTVILLGYLFVLTTSPNELAYALMRAGLPYRYGFTLVTALRMIPLFEHEALIVYRAQRVRGVTYQQKNLRDLLKSVNSLLLPMLVSAMSKVDALSISMEGRCYGKYPTRTYYRIRKTTRGDILAGLGLVCLITAVIVIKTMEG